jgi:predicted neutral ceramidase superfamily lipid hydrolase
MTLRDFILLLAVVFVGVFAALIVWTLIVKDQVSAQLNGTTASPMLALLMGNKPTA